MAASYFVIAILGCADGSAACTQVATAPTQYASKAECLASVNAVLADNSGFDFPTLMAECRAAERPISAKSERRIQVTGKIART